LILLRQQIANVEKDKDVIKMILVKVHISQENPDLTNGCLMVDIGKLYVRINTDNNHSVFHNLPGEVVLRDLIRLRYLGKNLKQNEPKIQGKDIL